MVGKLIIALIVIVSAIYVTQSKEDVDGADLAKELADARVMAAEKRTDAVREELKQMELRALAGEQRADKAEQQVAELAQKLKGKGEAAIEVKPILSPRGDVLVTPAAAEVRAVMERHGTACVVGTESRGQVQVRVNIRKDGSVVAVGVTSYGEKLEPFAHCLQAELERHRFSTAEPVLAATNVLLSDP